MRARSDERARELAAHNFHRLAHLRKPALAREEPRLAALSGLLVMFLSRFPWSLRELGVAPGEPDGPIDLLAESLITAGRRGRRWRGASDQPDYGGPNGIRTRV